MKGVWRLDCVGCEGEAKTSPGVASGIVCCASKGCTGKPKYALCNRTQGHHTDWDNQTRALLRLGQPHFTSGALLGVMLGGDHMLRSVCPQEMARENLTELGPVRFADELTLSGVPFAAFERWVDLVKEILDGIPLAAGAPPRMIYYMTSSIACG